MHANINATHFDLSSYFFIKSFKFSSILNFRVPHVRYSSTSRPPPRFHLLFRLHLLRPASLGSLHCAYNPAPFSPVRRSLTARSSSGAPTASLSRSAIRPLLRCPTQFDASIANPNPNIPIRCWRHFPNIKNQEPTSVANPNPNILIQLLVALS
jgi:hypothetical protein